MPTANHVPETDYLAEAIALRGRANDAIKSAKTQEDLNAAKAMLDEAGILSEKSKMVNALRDASTELINNPQMGADPEKDQNPNAPKGIKNFGHFLTLVKQAEKLGANEASSLGLRYFASEAIAEGGGQKDLAEGTGSTGGFLVPTEQSAELLAHLDVASIVRPRANKIPMTRRSIELPALKQEGTSTTEPNWFGGMTAFWEGEAEEIDDSDASFRMLTLTAWDLTAATHMSNNLIQDSAVSLAAFLKGPMGFSGVLAFKEDMAFLRGDGVGKPLGVLNSGATIAVARQTANDIEYDDLANIVARTMPTTKGVWIATLQARARLLLMKGPSGNPAYLWGDATRGIPDTLLGYPIFFTEKLPAVGQKGDIGFYDFSHYYIGDRQTITVESTGQHRWLKSQTSWKAISRIDGKPWLLKPFTLMDGVTYSPFVVLSDEVAA